MSNRVYTFFQALVLVLCMAVSSAHADASSAKSDFASEQRTPRVYEGWAVIRKQVIDPSAPGDEWVSMRDLKITDDGIKLRIKDGDSDTPYALELIVITYTQTNTTVLKLALYEDGKDKAITYIWGEPGANRLGMNLRWMQAGFTLKTDKGE